MSSVQSSFAQNKSRRLVANAAAPLFTSAAVNAALGVAAGSATNVGSLYTIDTLAHYSTFVGTLHAAVAGAPTYRTLTQFDTLTDMGNELVFGVAGGESELLKLRLVKNSVTGSGGSAGDGAYLGYVVVENNAFQAGINSLAGALPVKVSRV